MDPCNKSLKRKITSDEVEFQRNEMIKKPKWKAEAEIAAWANTFVIKADATTALLKILRQYDFPELHSDSRSLLNTPRGTGKLIRNVDPGHYIHIGIAEGILYTLGHHNVDTSTLDSIVIDYNTDGVQMTESTDNVFWPIWCRMARPRVGTPFLVGNYYSSSGQPKCFNTFTRDFILEFKKLMTEGLKVGYHHFVAVRPGRFFGDAPGRCDVLGLKHPTGYCGCGRCTAVGVYVNHRVCFTDLDAPLRTDKNFADRLQPEHHHFKSLVEEQLGLRCITQSPLDGMHLVYGCSVRRLLYWYNQDTVNFKLRLSSTSIDGVNKLLKVAMQTRPAEFARPVEDIRKFKRFKCTQLRQFLLYLSVVVMRRVLPKFQYEHLLLFVIGIRILSHEKDFKRKNGVAKKMLYEYVKLVGENFGKFRLIYSIHGLIHLADECITQNEPLDAFAMWEFETANMSLKEFTKRQGAYLEQSFNRTMERYHCRSDSNAHATKFPLLKFEIDKEYDDDFDVTKTFFSRIEYGKFMLDVSVANQWFLTKCGRIGRFNKAVLVGDEKKLSCQIFKQKFNYFENPLNSTLLSICQCYARDLSKILEIEVNQVETKMFMILDNNSLVFIPLL